MLKQSLFTLAGILLSIVGIISFYFWLQSLNDNGNLLLLVVTLLAFGASVYLFIRATRDESKEKSFMQPVTKELAKKNFTTKTDLINEYEKIDEARSKMKMLEAAGSVASEEE